MPSGGRHERVHVLDDELMTMPGESGGTEAAVPEKNTSGEPVPRVARGGHRAAVTGRATEPAGTVRA
ncbi:hypothetical protein J2853_001599 [Streptosporangium lutulentum]|uniref:Uncharacterized protein n=1 Tax=Streptosporangium lutulentum TaxID=1461250 RepID=A0ABT9Q7T9_9ACTN|nr:hypothetical protein [Streptosporangium lutulentum]